MSSGGARSAIFQALAQGHGLEQVREEFGLARQELEGYFQEVADHYREQEEGVWKLYCDGASRGNPGQAGAGVVLLDASGAIRLKQGAYLGRTTNNVAEYQALLLGLQLARNLGVRNIQVLADSELLVRQLNGQYKVKAPHLLPLWQAARRALQQFSTATIAHVPRELNRLADRMANEAIDQGR